VALQLEVLTGNLDPPPRVFVDGRRISLGRGSGCDVRLPDPSVSQLHASIVKRGQNYLLIDEGSRFGTGVARGHEPVWLGADSPRILEDGEHLWLGQIELRVQLVERSRNADSGLESLAETLVRAGLRAAGFTPTDQLVAATLKELTELPEEELPVPPAPSPAAERAGVADLFDEDKHPPWKTDLWIAGLALLVTAGCAFLYFHLSRLT
jgi:pSer/pThr/pTyr-binding forkhead associated (FHA) protein